ncbi:MAG TPA: DUF420 domain-containing protein [Verrucomicrobiae bacterium]|nr:DUF420 domain-containing protein [Verrucomicrobiae bacterium]
MSIYDLPAVNASLNGLSAIFLAAGFIFILLKKITAHKRCMISAFITSCVFLVCYLTYHTYLGAVLHRGPTRFEDPAWFRPYYLMILLSHTVLAAIVAPMILITIVRALRERFDKHKKIARWTWPIWMYVSISGVVVYWLLYVKFPQK